ncbi:MAG: hypothetical protein Q8L61_01625 [Hyphomicrobium sp.]|nr:hypothetical protein [Hyphomicrobium sp.]
MGLSADHGDTQSLTQRFSQLGSDAQAMALKHLMQITHRQGVVMAFGDVSLLRAWR